MAGHSRSKNGVASLAYVPVIPIVVAMLCRLSRDCRNKSGNDAGEEAYGLELAPDDLHVDLLAVRRALR